GAAPAVAVKETIKVVDAAHCVRSTPPRGMLYAVQTPQVFDIALYRIALEQLDDELITDDCGVFERAGYTVKLTEGDYANLKITTVEDLPITVKENTAMRIGHGYDVHRLVEGRELILGGVKVEYEKGLLGHSDADVLTHAIMDALLGAAALGDIGKQFPDSDDAYAGADSIALLCRVEELVRCEGYSIENVDATILCQKPKLAPAIPAMRERLATAMKLTVNAVSVKATTEEMLGFTGRGEGIAAHAVCLLSMR
ncbi:MAG: 2-C-methyl-D-erythritol 2,4-cyclodiphosphate synthase, partial [Pygmaiobacter sp.]